MWNNTEYRKTLGTFATGVTIITTHHGGEDFGFTANSFTSVSLDPPLVLFCIKEDATFIEGLDKAKVFGINVLSNDQEDLSNRFANPALLNEERFAETDTTLSKLKCPKIRGSLAYLDCQVVETMKSGDHFIIIGKVDSFVRAPEGTPLLYYCGGYRQLI